MVIRKSLETGQQSLSLVNNFVQKLKQKIQKHDKKACLYARKDTSYKLKSVIRFRLLT